MLQNIRDKSQGWFAWVVVSVVCVTFALWGIHSYLCGGLHAKVAAKVNGENITAQDLDQKFNQLKDRERRLNGNTALTAAQLSEIKKIALSQLIESVVTNQAARSNWFILSPILAEKALANMPIFQVNGQFSKDRFQTIMSRVTYSPEDFISQLNADIVNNQIYSGIVNTAFSLPEEVKTAIVLINQKRDFNYLTIKKEQFIKKVKLSDAELQQYYHENLDNYKTDAKLSLQYVYISINDLIDKIKPSEEQLQKFYQENIGLFTTPATWKLKSIFISLSKDASEGEIKKAKEQADYIAGLANNGGNFDDLMHLYSYDRDANTGTNDAAWQTLSQMQSDEKSVANELEKIGAISKPVRVDNGYRIFKAIDYKPKTEKKFADVKKNIIAMYKQNIAQQQYVGMNDRLASLAYENPSSLQSVATQLNLPIKKTEIFTSKGGGEKITQNKKVIAASFSDEVIKQHLNSDLINIDDNSAVVVRLNEYIPSAIKPLNVVKNEITKMLQNEKAEQLANEFAKNIVAQYKSSSEHWKDIIKANKLKLTAVIGADRNSNKASKEIINNIYKKMSASDINKCNLIALSNGDLAILQLINIDFGDTSIASGKSEYFSTIVKNSYGILDYNLYIKDLMNHAEIVYEKTPPI